MKRRCYSHTMACWIWLQRCAYFLAAALGMVLLHPRLHVLTPHTLKTIKSAEKSRPWPLKTQGIGGLHGYILQPSIAGMVMIGSDSTAKPAPLLR